MAIRKRGNLYQVDVTTAGNRIRETFKTKKAAAARELELVTGKNPTQGKRKPSGPRLPRLRNSTIQ
jgi:hypothetical protein